MTGKQLADEANVTEIELLKEELESTRAETDNLRAECEQLKTASSEAKTAFAKNSEDLNSLKEVSFILSRMFITVDRMIFS